MNHLNNLRTTNDIDVNLSSTPARFLRPNENNSRQPRTNSGDDHSKNSRNGFNDLNDLIPESFDFHESSSNKTPSEENITRYHDKDLDELEIQLSGYAEEGIKTLVAVLYCSCCFLITAYVMVCSAERAPERAS